MLILGFKALTGSSINAFNALIPVFFFLLLLSSLSVFPVFVCYMWGEFCCDNQGRVVTQTNEFKEMYFGYHDFNTRKGIVIVICLKCV